MLLSVPVISAAGPAFAAPPVIPPDITGAGQLYVVPAGTKPPVPFNGITVNAPPLHIISVCRLISGFGFIVRVTVNAGPVQLPEIGVTV